VLKLEAYLPPETMKAKERENAVNRIRAARMPALLTGADDVTCLPTTSLPRYIPGQLFWAGLLDIPRV